MALRREFEALFGATHRIRSFPRKREIELWALGPRSRS